MLTSKIIKGSKENLFQTDLDITRNYLWCCYEKDNSASVPPYWKSGGQFPHSLASLLTAISSHCLAALPAKMSAFNSYMRKTWCELDVNIRIFVAMLLLHNKDQQ